MKKKTDEKHGRSPFFFITENLLNYQESCLNSLPIIRFLQERLNTELAFKDFEVLLKRTSPDELYFEILSKLEDLKKDFVNINSFSFKKKKNFLREIFKLRRYYIVKYFKSMSLIFNKNLKKNSRVFSLQKLFFFLRQLNSGRLNINVGHTPFFFKASYMYFKNSDQNLSSIKNHKVYTRLFFEAAQVNPTRFLSELKFGIFSKYSKFLEVKNLSFFDLGDFFFNLVSLNTDLLSLKVKNYNSIFSNIIKNKKNKNCKRLIKKIIDDKVIFDKILIRSKQSFNFDDIVEPSNIAIVEKKVPLKKTNNI